MSRDLSARLAAALQVIDRPGTFCTACGGAAPLPGLEVAGLGPVGLPLTTAQVPELVARCRQAPYGKGERTLVDTSVRRVWQMDPDRFALTNPDWQPYLTATVQAVQRELGLERQPLDSHLYNLLLYEPGGFFLPHRDGEKLDRMVATLVVVLPGAFAGGELVVRHEGHERVLEFGGAARNPCHTHFAAFYADCEHEVRPLGTGYRLCLVYNLTLAKAHAPIAAPRTSAAVEAVADVLRGWAPTDPRKLAVPLEHQYTEGGLAWDALKGVDRAKALALSAAAARAGCSAHLALLTLHESGTAEEHFAPRRGRRGNEYDDERNPANYEMGEVFETSLTADHWSAGGGPDFGAMEVGEGEIVPTGALRARTPEVDVSGYTGNEGLTMNRWYRRAAVVVWPAAHRFDVLCDCGTARAVAALGELVDRWQQARGPGADALGAECATFAHVILDRWGGAGYRGETGAAFQALVLRLDDVPLIGRFLTRVAASDPFVELGAPLAKAFDAYGWDTFRAPLVALFEGTTAATVGRNLRFSDQLCASGARPKGARRAVCELLAEKAVAAVDRLDRDSVATDWRLRDVNRTEVLTALCRALVAVERYELLSSFATRALADPTTYPLAAHVAALTALGPWLKKHLKAPCEPVARWLAVCCAQLDSRTAVEPVAPTDFRREATVRCNCADCEELKAFLTNPAERVHRFRVRQERRQHIEHRIAQFGCDATCVTDRTGSPQTLVCTKTTASFDARLTTYRADRAHLATLRAIRASLPA